MDITIPIFISNSMDLLKLFKSMKIDNIFIYFLYVKLSNNKK